MNYQSIISDNRRMVEIRRGGNVPIQIDMLACIDTILEFDSFFIVLISPPEGEIMNENIFAYSLDGTLLWQIPIIPHVYEDSPYKYIGKEGEILVATNWDGLKIRLNAISGEVISTEESR